MMLYHANWLIFGILDLEFGTFWKSLLPPPSGSQQFGLLRPRIGRQQAPQNVGQLFTNWQGIISWETWTFSKMVEKPSNLENLTLRLTIRSKRKGQESMVVLVICGDEMADTRVYAKYSGLVPPHIWQLWKCKAPVDGRTTMSSESVCQVACSWAEVGSFHTPLVVRFMIFTASV
jgi:hypothetical protein